MHAARNYPKPPATVEPIRSSASAPFSSFGEQLSAVMASSRAPFSSPPDARLLELNALQLRAQAAGASEQIPSDGGFLVQPDFSRELVRRMYLTGRILDRCFKFPMTGSGIAYPQIDESSRATGSRLGGIQVYWENEADSDSTLKSKPAFSRSTIPPHKIIGLLYVTDELTRDSDALSAWASYAFPLEMAFVLENAIVNGTGSGQPLGIVNSKATLSVTKETGQGAGSLLNLNVIKMMGNLWAPSWDTACWLFNQDLLPYLFQLTTVVGSAGSQSSLFHFSENPGEPNMLCGIPAYPSEYCQAPGTVGDIILADFSRYLVALREQRADVSIHINFSTDESAFRFVMRVNGQPIDTAPVAALNSSSSTKTSPFVVLGAR